ncbi:hypothetical protein [Paenibacillus glycanilyticus]|uniref:Uncharacterized protein n=1 Tax=Paenibacillus glycanilyticus TaxID=126569 RepID=A0ABQ6GI73_9BACL|nr:hypothetical protein [Paenibacillus glycanilyticus]GLX70513.1 hypothetical protein MU1_48590 [Paenibacillus glycanilyticus]
MDTEFIESIVSPNKVNTVYIEHREATLGETNYFYTFFKKEGLFMKEIKGHENHLISQYRPSQSQFTAEEALGLQNVEWMTEETLTFHTINGDVSIKLK